MPLYHYACPHCGNEKDAFVRVEERHSGAPECHGLMELEIMPTHVMPDITPYKAVAGDKMGQEISSRKQHKEFLKRNGFREVGTDPIKPIRNNTRPKKGEVAEELKRVIQPYLRH